MKRFLSTVALSLLVAMLLTAFTGCGSSKPSGSEGSSQESSSTVSSDDSSKESSEEASSEESSEESSQEPSSEESSEESSQDPSSEESSEESKPSSEESSEEPETSSSSKPAASSKPDKNPASSKPNKPAKPDKPTKPSKPNKPTKPDKDPASSKPEKPSKPESSSSEETKPAMDSTSLLNLITADAFLPASAPVDEAGLDIAYGIDPAILESYTYIIPMINIQATEFALFQVKDEKDIATVKAAIEKRVSSLSKQWEHYLADQYQLVQDYQLKTIGSYVLFVISEDADSVVAAFESALS